MTSVVSPYEAARWIRTTILGLPVLPRSVAIFGSFSTAQWPSANDIDLLIVGNSLPRRPGERSGYIHPLVSQWRRKVPAEGLPFPVTLSPLFLSEEGWLGSCGLRLSLSEGCWILWDDGFLSDSLEEARQWRAQGKWRKELIPSGGFFWIPEKGVA